MFFIEQILAWAVGLGMGFIFSELFVSRYKNKKFGGWFVIVKNGEQLLTTRKVGCKKAEEVLDDPSTLSIFVKGIVSPFCWLNEDVVSDKAMASGLFQVSFQNKTWTVDISKNPPKADPPKKG